MYRTTMKDLQGGWDTATTRLRMNQASNQYNLGYKVYRKKGVTTDYLLGV